MPYKRTGRRPGRPTKAEAEERRRATPTTPTAKPRQRHILSDAQIIKAIDGLKPQHAIATAALLQGKSRSEAAREAGLNPSSLSPSRESGQIIQSAAIRALTRAGVTPDKLAQRHAESLDAKETKFWSDKGVVTDERTVVSHNIRLDAVREGWKIHDAYPHEKPDPDHGQGPIVSIQFLSRQPATEPTEQRVTAAIAFGPRRSGDGGSE